MKTDSQPQHDLAMRSARASAPQDQVIKYEAALKIDKYLLVAHGSAADHDKARSVLAQARATAAV